LSVGIDDSQLNSISISAMKGILKVGKVVASRLRPHSLELSAQVMVCTVGNVYFSFLFSIFLVPK